MIIVVLCCVIACNFHYLVIDIVMESEKELIERLMAERKLIDNKITEIVSKSYSKYGMS